MNQRRQRKERDLANEQNLIPGAHKLTVEEQSAGGVASGKARREKKLLRELAQMILEEEITDTNGRTMTQGEAALRKQAILAIKEGDTKALAFLRDTAGQAPVQRVEVDTIDPQARAEMDELLGLGD